ncbi:MAG: hypothetical protein WCL71_04640, partial [Deltaproteobacteria bacterium]
FVLSYEHYLPASRRGEKSELALAETILYNERTGHKKSFDIMASGSQFPPSQLRLISTRLRPLCLAS